MKAILAAVVGAVLVMTSGIVGRGRFSQLLASQLQSQSRLLAMAVSRVSPTSIDQSKGLYRPGLQAVTQRRSVSIKQIKGALARIR